jgi:hypothetical protein
MIIFENTELHGGRVCQMPADAHAPVRSNFMGYGYLAVLFQSQDRVR